MTLTVVTPSSFPSWVRDNARVHPVVLMVQMQGCRPCKKLLPQFERMAKQHADVSFGTYIIDPSDESHKVFVQTLRVRATPTFQAYDLEGKQVFTGQASTGLAQLAEFLQDQDLD